MVSCRSIDRDSQPRHQIYGTLNLWSPAGVQAKTRANPGEYSGVSR